MTWNENYRVGIPEVDAQHRQLCDQIDVLYSACSNGKGAEEALKTLNFLESYTKKHFSDEERIQLRIKYPKYAQHKKLHDEFITKIAEMKKELTTGGSGISAVIKINQMISDWLVNHIMKVDKELKTYY